MLIPAAAKQLRVTACWGEYRALDENGVPVEDESEALPSRWRRTDRHEELTLDLGTPGKPREFLVPNSGSTELKGGALFLVLSVRAVRTTKAFEGLLPAGTRSVSVFLVNRRRPGSDLRRDEGFIFQAAFEVRCDVPLQRRPNLRGLDTNDWDECVADLQFRDAFEYAVGHGVATRARLGEGGECREVHTRWIPSAEVERVAPVSLDGVEMGMEALASLKDGPTASAKLTGLVSKYRAWIDTQKTTMLTKQKRKETAAALLTRAGVAANRIEAGIALLADPVILDAFRTANKVMALAARHRFAVIIGQDPAKVTPPTWRPFQLAFLLMNLLAIADPGHSDREVVDLLFFPTGGGKTEAYLGLTVFTLVLRRLRNPGVTSSGLTVLMRYTLRLLTLDQLGRAATLICALELGRQQDVARLGEWPFEIGLWVGLTATPNVTGKKGNKNPNSARTHTIAYKNNSQKASPIPLEECPWCGRPFTPNSFQLTPQENEPLDLRVTCVNRDCAFRRSFKTLGGLHEGLPTFARMATIPLAPRTDDAGRQLVQPLEVCSRSLVARHQAAETGEQTMGSLHDIECSTQAAAVRRAALRQQQPQAPRQHQGNRARKAVAPVPLQRRRTMPPAVAQDDPQPPQ